MISGFFSAISRLRWIQRWSLKRNTLTENVMEHSWEVAVIAHMLGCINNQRYNGSINPDRLSTLALYHDSSEAITGDLPTPVKYYSEEIQKAYKVIEEDAERSLVAMLPEELRGVFNQVVCGQGVTEQEAKFVKAADNLSAYVKALAEIANGNKEYETTINNLKQRLTSYQLPEVDYFLSTFVAEQNDEDNPVSDAASQFENKALIDNKRVTKLKLA